MDTLVGMLIGGVITWLVSYCYYEKAGDDLKTETKKLRKLNTFMLNVMERNKWGKFNRDEWGEIVGEFVPLSGSVSGRSDLKATLTVTEKTDEKGTGG